MIRFELKKNRIWLVLLIILLIGVRLISVLVALKEEDPDEELYKEIIARIRALPKEDATAYIGAELDRCMELIDKKEEMEEAYSYAYISFEEFHEYNLERKKAENSLGILNELLLRSEAYDSLIAEGKTPSFFYDRHEENLRKNILGGELIVIVILVFAASNIALLDKENRMDEMVLSCAFPKRKLHRERLLAVLFVTFLSAAVLCIGEWVTVNVFCEPEALEAKAYSVLEYSSADTNMTLKTMFLAGICLKVAALCLTSCIAYAIASIIGNRIFGILVIFGILIMIFVAGKELKGPLYMLHFWLAASGDIIKAFM
jgi:hypothetical protein